jgi:hypothetical protein
VDLFPGYEDMENPVIANNHPDKLAGARIRAQRARLREKGNY